VTCDQHAEMWKATPIYLSLVACCVPERVPSPSYHRFPWLEQRHSELRIATFRSGSILLQSTFKEISMTVHASSMNAHTILFLLALLPIFAVVFLVAREALRVSPFRGPAGLALAVCISLLAVLGMLDFGGGIVVSRSDGARNNGSALQVVLIPYAALAISSALILALWLLNSLCQYKRTEAKMNIERRSRMKPASALPRSSVSGRKPQRQSQNAVAYPERLQ
jgi:small-conductance mechanosensitive channel